MESKRANRVRVAVDGQLKRRAPRRRIGRASVGFEQFGQSVRIENVQPTAIIVGFDHPYAQRGNERPIFVAVRPFHFRDGVRPGVEAEYFLRPAPRLRLSGSRGKAEGPERFAPGPPHNADLR